MALRFEQQYKTKRLDNLGDPEWHNRRWQDIDRRMHARELDADKIDNAVDNLEAVALSRLNDTFTPVIETAIERLRSVGAVFAASSQSEATIGAGEKTFLVSEDERDSFVVTDYVAVSPRANPAYSMTLHVIDYQRASGLLTGDTVSGRVIGIGTFSDWVIRVSVPPSVGTYSAAETDAAIAAAINALIDGAPTGLTTLKQIADAINDDPAVFTTLVNLTAGKLAKAANLSDLSDLAVARGNLGLDAHYVRYTAGQTLSPAQKQTVATNIGGVTVDAVQSLNATQKQTLAANIGSLLLDAAQALSTAQKQQAASNVSGTGPGQILALDNNSRIPRVDATVLDGVPKIPQGRLTVSSSGAPWGPQHGSLIVSALRYVPYVGGYVPIYDPSYGGLRMAKFTTSDSDALGYNLNMAGSSNFPANSIMDLFAAFHPTSGAIVIGAGSPWSAATIGGAARAPAGGFAKYQGVDVNASTIGLRTDPTTLLTIQAGCATWLGTMYLWAANQLWWLSFKADDISTPGQVPLWNRYNQKRLNFGRSNPTGSWTVGQSLNYSGTNPNGGIIYWVDGAGGEPFEASYYQYVTPGASSSGFLAIGHNGVSAEAEYGYLWPGLTQNYEAQLRHKRSTLGLNFVGQLIQCITEVGTLAGGTPNNMIMLGVDL
jgi:hypothetical protein